jgi:hypothetical protein
MLLRLGVVLLVASAFAEIVRFAFEREAESGLITDSIWNAGFVGVFAAFALLLLSPLTASRAATVAQRTVAGVSILALAVAIFLDLTGHFVTDERLTGEYRSFSTEMAEVVLVLGAIAQPFAGELARRIALGLLVVSGVFVVYAAARHTFAFESFEWYRFAETPAILAAAVALPARLNRGEPEAVTT